MSGCAPSVVDTGDPLAAIRLASPSNTDHKRIIPVDQSLPGTATSTNPIADEKKDEPHSSSPIPSPNPNPSTTKSIYFTIQLDKKTNPQPRPNSPRPDPLTDKNTYKELAYKWLSNLFTEKKFNLRDKLPEFQILSMSNPSFTGRSWFINGIHSGSI